MAPRKLEKLIDLVHELGFLEFKVTEGEKTVSIIKAILMESGRQVEYGQPLFVPG